MALCSTGVSVGQTVEKSRVQPGKTVPREFPRAHPKGTPLFLVIHGSSLVIINSDICSMDVLCVMYQYFPGANKEQ